MEPATMMAIGSGLMGFLGQREQGRQQAVQAQQQARQMEIDRKIAEAQALEMQNQRISDYNYAKATNNAQFSFQLGGGESSSLAAFERYQRETMSSDITTSQRQAFIEGSGRSVSAMLERSRGSNAAYAGRINSMTSLFDMGSKLAKIYKPAPSSKLAPTTSIRPANRSL